MRRERTRRTGGLATIVVLAILAILGTLLVVNARVLTRMKDEIRLLELKQTRKFQDATNSVTRPGPGL